MEHIVNDEGKWFIKLPLEDLYLHIETEPSSDSSGKSFFLWNVVEPCEQLCPCMWLYYRLFSSIWASLMG